MPFINVIRGERIADAPLNLRTPALRVPTWMVLTWWVLKALALAVFYACRYWFVTGPTVLLIWLYARFDWYAPVGLVAGLTLLLGVWWWRHRTSCERFVVFPAWSRWRRFTYRRRWAAAMTTARLAVVFDGQTVLPILKRVRSTRSGDVLTVRMVTGQIPDDYAAVGERLAHTFGALGARVTAGNRPDLVVIALRRRDPLGVTVAALPVAAEPDFTALPLGVDENGGPYRLRLFGTQVLVVGATGAGKGSVVWSLIAALAAGVRAGTVKLWAFDPKGGMEMSAGLPLFDRFACTDFRAMADLLEEAVDLMRDRTARLRGRTRQHTPTVDDPLYVLVIDELATLTAYVVERQTKDRIKAALGVLLTQGRAVGFHIVAALQDPRKEVLPFRNLFPTRIGLRLSEEAEVDMVLGDGARDRGALCDRIPQALPGVGFVVLDGDPTPTRVRFSYWTDDDIRDLAREFGRLRVIDGELAEPKGGAA